MALQVGSRLGHYDVTALIGEGGMGQVYQATDTTLNRQVALKILPEAFAEDPDRLARFQREAQVLASLNHPNIAAIHGLEESDDTRALVLELVEGPTLADRIKQGPIPVEEALPIAKQIAEALEAAHEQGIIHRDLKPANIKVRDDGTVKVLDFGLAKAMEGSGSDASESPTVTAAATAQGVILGTAAYMSPEQARGKSVDKRADIWSFGAVLFEMLTGQRSFEGRDVSEVLAGVLRLDPKWDALPGDTPPHLHTLLKRCLEKEPRERLRDMGDVLLALKGAFETEVTLRPEPAISQRVGWLPWVAGVALAVVSSLAVWTVMRPDAVPAEVMRFVIVPPASTTINAKFAAPILAISPDGSQVVYEALGPSGPQLYLHRIGEIEGEPLRGAEGGRRPVFSPDGEWIAFAFQSLGTGAQTLKKLPTSGGQAITLTEPPNGFVHAISWGTNDQIVFGQSTSGGLFAVSANGGQAEALTTLEGSDIGHTLPDVIPGRNAVLFVTAPNMPVTTLGELCVVDLDTGDIKRLGIAGTSPQYASTGHLVYAASGGVIRAVPFDATSLEVTGSPVQLVDRVVDTGIGAHFSLSDAGTLAYVSGESLWPDVGTLVWVDEDGREEPLPLDVHTGYEHSAVSPDGTQIATVHHSFEGQDLWVYDVSNGRGQKVTEDFVVQSLVWLPEGDRIIVGSNHENPTNIYSVSADGSGEPELLLASDEWDYPTSVTPDGQKVVFARGYGGQNAARFEIWEIATSGDEPPVPILQGELKRRNPEYSPDGNWLAYWSEQSGTREVYVQPYPGPGPVLPVSVGGGTHPVWARDGSRLFFIQGDQVMAAPFDSTDPSPLGSSVPAFEAGYIGARSRVRHYDVARDGRMLTRRVDALDQTPFQLVVIQNWSQELLERVPVD